MFEKYVDGADDFLLQLIFDFLVELIEGASISYYNEEQKG